MNAQQKLSQRLRENGGLSLRDVARMTAAERTRVYVAVLNDEIRVYEDHAGDYRIYPASEGRASAVDFSEALARTRIACGMAGEVEGRYLVMIREDDLTAVDASDDETAEAVDGLGELETVAA